MQRIIAKHKKQNLKSIVRGAYDLQKLRIQTGLRIVCNFKSKLGLEPSAKEEELDKDGQEILTALRIAYQKITDGVVRVTPKSIANKGQGIISDFAEYSLVRGYIRLHEEENALLRGPSCALAKTLNDFPIWTEFLVDVKGIGPAMAGVLISEIDIEKARYPSSLWAYAGLDVAKDGMGRSKKKEHLVDSSYTAKDGTIKMKRGISFNPFLKSKLIGVLATSFVRAGDNPYREIYDNYKNRLENNPKHEEKSKGHRHNMALRYMIKRFLVDLHKTWRALEGLSVSEEYSVAKLGIKHKVA